MALRKALSEPVAATDMRGRGPQRKRVNTSITKDRHGRAQRDRIFGEWAVEESNLQPWD
jgi:hypothetical protein